MRAQWAWWSTSGEAARRRRAGPRRHWPQRGGSKPPLVFPSEPESSLDGPSASDGRLSQAGPGVERLSRLIRGLDVRAG